MAEVFSPHPTCHRKSAFTLAEVLITLGIIGVVAAMTMPALIANYQKNVLKNQFKKTYSLISQAYRKAEVDLGYAPECFYWDKIAAHHCVAWTESGECSKYELMDGSPLPADINGKFEDCNVVRQKVLDNLKVIKSCPNNAYRGGCLPDYDGNDTLKKKADDSLSDKDLIKATSGCGLWRKNNIANSTPAYVLADGEIILYSAGNVFAVDINGKKGPNKWGHDLFEFSTVGNYKSPMRLDYGRCGLVDKNGVTTAVMMRDLYKK